MFLWCVVCCVFPPLQFTKQSHRLQAAVILSVDATMSLSDLTENRTTGERNKINFIRIPEMENIPTEASGQSYPF